MATYDLIIIGGGPAGLAAAGVNGQHHKKVLLIEREGRLGGILKQCIHDGFGLTRYKEKLAGPEYAEREIERLKSDQVTIKTLSFVSKIEKTVDGFALTLITRQGIEHVKGNKLILATGCRERTAKQVAIHGTNPAGILTAGSAQYYMNILGQMPTKRCVILGSGDIGLIMARRITLEGGHVIGVYEIKPTPSGLTRNLVQCLDDFEIPLYLSMTVTKVYGVDRLEAVDVVKVDDDMHPIPGTEEHIACDALILSVGLIPENEIAEQLAVPINPKTKGPFVDQGLETLVAGVYSCGNSLHVSDVADMVSETGETAAITALGPQSEKRELVEIACNNRLLYIVPSHIDLCKNITKIIMYFRVNACYENQTVTLFVNDKPYLKRHYRQLRPPEMERLVVNLTKEDKIASLRLEAEDAK